VATVRGIVVVVVAARGNVVVVVVLGTVAVLFDAWCGTVVVVAAGGGVVVVVVANGRSVVVVVEVCACSALIAPFCVGADPQLARSSTVIDTPTPMATGLIDTTLNNMRRNSQNFSRFLGVATGLQPICCR
jgi:hypothetical protein